MYVVCVMSFHVLTCQGVNDFLLSIEASNSVSLILRYEGVEGVHSVY